MNTCQFMDKQIMDLSSSSSLPSTDFIDLMNNHDGDDHQKKQVIGDNGLDSKKEVIVPSYDFHPIRPTTAARLSHSALDLAGSTTRVNWSASDYKPVSTTSPNTVLTTTSRIFLSFFFLYMILHHKPIRGLVYF